MYFSRVRVLFFLNMCGNVCVQARAIGSVIAGNYLCTIKHLNYSGPRCSVLGEVRLNEEWISYVHPTNN